MSVSPSSETSQLKRVIDYHERTKHHLDRYAASAGRLDWSTQPEPFRSWSGCERIPLEHPSVGSGATYDGLFSRVLPSRDITRGTIASLFYHALALSAWKQTPQGERWALRVNPSSGNLHPTEAYVLCGALPDLDAGLYHYAPEEHALERRIPPDQQVSWQPPGGGFVIVLSSILWREVWKYGERAYRYCQHDVGHALAALHLSAAMLGWSVVPLAGLNHGELTAATGLSDRDQEPEGEYAEIALAITVNRPTTVLAWTTPPWARTPVSITLIGSPNRLSPHHHAWPVIGEVERATRNTSRSVPDVSTQLADPSMHSQVDERSHDCGALVRRRRSAVAMDGTTALTQAEFLLMLERVVPSSTPRPFTTLPGSPEVSLLLFVHRVDDCDPGLYLLGRAAGHLDDLRNACSAKGPCSWTRPAWAPPHLDLQHLAFGDARQIAQTICCHQEIAADGAFAVAMLARLEATLEKSGPPAYRRLFWECGMIGQVLYLEAEAASRTERPVRATGIGCFFDDEVHTLIGLEGRRWQSLYHFTVGGPREDRRLTTLPAYPIAQRVS